VTLLYHLILRSPWLRLHLALVFAATLATGYSMPGHDWFAFGVGMVLMASFVVLAPKGGTE